MRIFSKFENGQLASQNKPYITCSLNSLPLTCSTSTARQCAWARSSTTLIILATKALWAIIDNCTHAHTHTHAIMPTVNVLIASFSCDNVSRWYQTRCRYLRCSEENNTEDIHRNDMEWHFEPEHTLFLLIFRKQIISIPAPFVMRKPSNHSGFPAPFSAPKRYQVGGSSRVDLSGRGGLFFLVFDVFAYIV